jgi:hypothetical protein
MDNSNKEQKQGFKTKGRLIDKADKRAAHELRKIRKGGRGHYGLTIACSLEG